jgi:hypothetical protein
MLIFIPVLLICMNGTANCEFMQARAYYKTDDQCRAVLDAQKIHMRSLITESKAGTITVLEGTCVEANIRERGITA